MDDYREDQLTEKVKLHKCFIFFLFRLDKNGVTVALCNYGEESTCNNLISVYTVKDFLLL